MVRRLSGRSSRLVLVAVVIASTACESPSSKPEQTATPRASLGSPPSAVPTDADSAVQAADRAYRGMWDAYLRVLAAPDPDSPELARYATGDALKVLVDGVRDVRDQGLKGEGRFVLSPRVTDATPDNAPNKISIRDCLNDAGARIVRASPGVAYSDKPGGLRLCLATMQRQSDGTWKVTSFGLREVGTCT
jgi:hypothetical protein